MMSETERMDHDLKTLERFFDLTFIGKKNFEIRLNDRDFKFGDTVHLWEFDGKDYTGRGATVVISEVIKNVPGLIEGYVLLMIVIIKLHQKVPNDEKQ